MPNQVNEMRLFFVALCFFLVNVLTAQNDSIRLKKIDTASVASKGLRDSTLGKKKETKTLGIEDYKIISYGRDTTFVDTTQSIQKEYKYNFLRRDDFELMPFANVGQPYNRLGRDFQIYSLYPNIGASAKHYNYQEVYEVDYYNVPTPLTELMFKTTFEQGQLLDALLTFNTSERLNASIAFKGFRSLGKYQFEQAESGNFKSTFNYATKNYRYTIRGHIAAQNSETEENGGLLNKEVQFESGDPEFLDRSRIDVLYANANNRVLGRRYFFDHQYKLINVKNDSLNGPKTSLAIGHEFNYESRFYQFEQAAPNAAFGEESFSSDIDDKATLKTLFNGLSTEFYNKTLGTITAKVGFYDYDYFFNSILINEDQVIENKLEGTEITAGGHYRNKIGGFTIDGGFNYTLSGELSGNQFDASASYDLNEANAISLAVHSSSRLPNFNYLLYQSDYQNFNWQNTANFEKQNVQKLVLTLDSKLLGSISAQYNTIDNYAYFQSTATEEQLQNNQETAFVRPFQETGTIDYLRLKYTKQLKWKNWALTNTVLYQEVSQDNAVLNVPQLITRNTLSFSKDVFKKAMFLQTGVTFKYFTAYNADAYHPLLGEFYTQNREEIGGYPMLDFFINAKIRQTRIFLKAEHFNSSFTGYDFYAAPNYPYRDFVIRFGLVWNFFS